MRNRGGDQSDCFILFKVINGREEGRRWVRNLHNATAIGFSGAFSHLDVDLLINPTAPSVNSNCAFHVNVRYALWTKEKKEQETKDQKRLRSRYMSLAGIFKHDGGCENGNPPEDTNTG